jgi:hypothetical protein
LNFNQAGERPDRLPAVGDYLIALQTYRAAVQRWRKDTGFIEQSWED